LPPREQVVLLTRDGPLSGVVWRALRHRWPSLHAVVEAPLSRGRLIRRRLTTLGPVTVAGQVAFAGLVAPLLRRRGAPRIRRILAEHRLEQGAVGEPATRVASVNTPEARAALRALAPDVVVVHGTGILTDETLRCVSAPFINMHTGITPFCRGVHGGYWALADGRADLAGVTVHLVDRGIDTGPVLAQAIIQIGPDDSYATYPALQTAAGLPLLVDAVERALAGTLAPRAPLASAPSRLRTHPTLWGYLWRRAARQVR
jgi:folate-dependent phosphoribosylglycinamide formyltransferase PurN